MKRAVSWVQTVAIIILAAAAVVQMYRLWLVDIPAGNFFLYLQARFPGAAPGGHEHFAVPMRTFVHAGGGRFAVSYGAGDEWEIGRRAVEAVLRSGVAAPGAQMEHGLVFEYAFSMDGARFAGAFGRGVPAGMPAQFSQIAVEPPQGGVLRLAFIDHGQAYIFEVVLGSRRHPVADYIFELPPVDIAAIYFTQASGQFIPHVQGGFAYFAPVVSNPYMDALGLFNQNFVRSRVSPFFDNPASINQNITGGVFTYSNLNVVVRYLPNHVLEYTSFRTIGRAAPATFMGDFSAAYAFIEADPYVINDIFLAGYEVRGREHVFYFGYIVAGWGLVLGEPWQTREGCTEPLLHPIEVVVDHGRVVRYRRITHNFSPGEAVQAGGSIAEPRFTFGMDDVILRMGEQ
jgi:hypothetical protein